MCGRYRLFRMKQLTEEYFARGLWGSFVVLILALLATPFAFGQTPSETMLSPENAYNPIPSPDGKYIAYVRIGWNRESGGFGRSSLVSEVAIIDANGKVLVKNPIANGFLSGWTPDSRDVVRYRDGEYSLASMAGKLTSKGRLPGATNVIGTERVSYWSRSGVMIWSGQDGFHTALETPKGVLTEDDGWHGSVIAPSPDGRFVAVAGDWPRSDLWVYDTILKKWKGLGEVDIHPARDWDYIKPSWNPWFADSSRLAYFTCNGSALSIRTPDGKQRTDIQVGGTAGLAAPSPDRRTVAYVTFESRPRKIRPDLQFWGGTRIWLVSLSGKPEPHPVTQKSLDETYDLRWLDDYTVVFDRVAEGVFYERARIWRTRVPR
jgi:hypothetical protein